MQVAAVTPEFKYLNVRFLPHAVCDGNIVSVTVLVPCANMQKNTIAFQRIDPIFSTKTEVFIAATKSGHLNHEQFKEVYTNIIVPGIIYSRNRLLYPEMRMYSVSLLSKSTHAHLASSDTAQIDAETQANQNLFTHINSNNEDITSDRKMNENSSISDNESEFDDSRNERVESTSDDDSNVDVGRANRNNYSTNISATTDEALNAASDSPVDMLQTPEMVLWLDGEPAQIKSIMSSDMLRHLKENNVTVNKNRSALEQPLDVCPNGFNTLHHMFAKAFALCD